mmetsp:Transcript_31563/g.105397  ORF Transcript_31563/g.105397 Transcript_31563/m.105397 type:complete len:231 (+) Transcript_31563:63-755(+)
MGRHAVLLLTLSASAHALHLSTILSLRGGGAAAPTAAVAQTSVGVDEAPPAALFLKVIGVGTPSKDSGPRVELGSEAYGALKLVPNAAVTVRKLPKKGSNKIEQAVVRAVEAPELDAASVRVLTKDLRLQVGEQILVAPMQIPAVAAGQPSERVVVERHHGGFLHNYLWYRMLFGGVSRPYGYGHGGGYGGGLGGAGGSSRRAPPTSYKSRSYSRGRGRVGGRRVGGRRR